MRDNGPSLRLGAVVGALLGIVFDFALSDIHDALYGVVADSVAGALNDPNTHSFSGLAALLILIRTVLWLGFYIVPPAIGTVLGLLVVAKVGSR